MKKPVEPTIESLAETLRLNVDFVKAASLTEQQKQDYAKALNKGTLIKKWVGTPAALVMCAFLMGGGFVKNKEGGIPLPLMGAFAVAAAAYFAERKINKTDKVFHEISSAADKNLLEFYRNKMSL